MRVPSLALAGALAASAAALASWLHPEWLFGKYPNLAAGLLANRLTPAQVSDASPGYLWLNLLVTPGGLRVLQLAAAAAAVVAVFAVARALGGTLAAWAAAAGLALAGPWLVYPSVLEPDLLVGVLHAGAAAALLTGGAPPGPRRAALAGVLLGLSCALRPTGALFAAAALAWLLLAGRGAPLASRARRAGALALAAISFAFAAPVALGSRTGLDWRTTMSAGQVLHLGHRPEGSGLGANLPTLLALVALAPLPSAEPRPDPHHQLYRDFASVAAGRPLEAAEAELFWVERTRAFAAREPGAFLRQLGRKAVFVFASPGDDHDIPAVQQAVRGAAFGGIADRWIALAGLAGIALAWRRASLLALWVAAHVAACLVFYTSSRYALAVLPALAVLGGLAVAAVWDARRSPRRLLRLAPVAAAPLLLLALPWVRAEARLRERMGAMPAVSRTAEALRAGRVEEARRLHAEEQADLPDHLWPWSPHGEGVGADDPDQALRAAELSRGRYGDGAPADAFLLAVLYAGAERCDLALPLAARASAAGFHGAIADTSLDPDLLASDCLLEAGDRSGAAAAVDRSLARWPGTLDGLARGVAAAESAGDEARASARLDALTALHDPASARWALARARRSWGAPLRAMEDAAWLRAHVPAAARLADFELGLSLLALGRPADALAAYSRSLVGRYPMHGARRFDEAIRGATRARPGDRGLLVLALRHWLSRGDRAEVRRLVSEHPDLRGLAPAVSGEYGPWTGG